MFLLTVYRNQRKRNATLNKIQSSKRLAKIIQKLKWDNYLMADM